MSVDEAQSMAREAGMDLVEVSPTERPPVCRIMDYGRHLYQQKKKLKQSQASQHHTTLKEIRVRPRTDTHDIDIKISRAKEFLAEGHKVQFTMLFRGRERAHRDVALDSFDHIVETLGDLIRIERTPIMEGRRMTMIVAPAKAK